MVGGATFSEQWYQVANLRVALLPSVRVHKQMIHGTPWYILTEPYTRQYFKISSEAYLFLARLTPKLTVDEVWNNMLDTYPEQAPGQEESVRILSQLHHANLLYFNSLPDGAGIFEREKRIARKTFYTKIASFLFVRIPLVNPNDRLNRIKHLARIGISLPAFFIWTAAIVFGLLSVVQNSHALSEQTQGILAVENLPWLYLCIAGLKILHELSHALACKRYGGDVHVMGVMFLVFVPLPYMDATASWAFRERRQRIIVSCAGMTAELFAAALAAVVWARTGAGTLHSLAFNVMLVGSVSSLLFNGNPLLRYDAYFILSDLLDIPNLSQKAGGHCMYLLKRYLMGSDSVVSTAIDRTQAVWLTLYGILATLYRLVLSFFIILIVLDRFFAVGVVLIISSLIIWGVRPAWKIFEYLLSPEIQTHRQRAVWMTLLLIFTGVSIVGKVPFPVNIKAPGVIEAVSFHPVTTNVSGILHRIHIQPGQRIRTGQVLVELINPDLKTDQTLTRNMILENSHLMRKVLWKSPADIAPLKQQMAMLKARLAELDRQHAQLVIHAPADGVWVAPQLSEKLNNWFTRGQLLGRLIGDTPFRFTAVVSQEQANELFGSPLSTVELRLRGQADQGLYLPAQKLKLIPFRRERLASAALGWAGGGAIATMSDDKGGQLAPEGFFEVRAALPQVSSAIPLRLMHGLSGTLRIGQTPRPLFVQARRKLRQLAQKRYGLSF